MEPTEIPFSALVHPCARVEGRVVIGERGSVWAHAVVCGVVTEVRIGAETSIQENCCLVPVYATQPLIIGNRVTIDRSATLHGCTIGDECLIRAGAVVLTGAHIGHGSIVGPRAVVPAGMKVPPNSVVTGVPGRIRRAVTAVEHQRILDRAAEEIRLIDQCKQEFRAMARQAYLGELARKAEPHQEPTGRKRQTAEQSAGLTQEGTNGRGKGT